MLQTASSGVPSQKRTPHEMPEEDRQHAFGVAYRGVLDRMQFNLQRRINLATGIGDQSLKALVMWAAVFGTAKTIPVDYKSAHAVLEAVYLWLPVFGMLLCTVYMGIGKTVYQDEINYLVEALRYEKKIDGYGVANIRALEIVDASYWRPATTEVAGIMWFALWLMIDLISRYNAL